MPSLVFEVRDENGNKLSAVAATSDGKAFAERLDGTPVAIDPGEHHFTFESSGMVLATKTIVVREGDKARHERIELHFLKKTHREAILEPPSSKPSAPGATTTRDAEGQEASAHIAQKEWLQIPPLAIVAMGVGAAGFAVGIGAGIAGESKHTALELECATDGACPVSAQGELDAFHSLTTASTIGYAIGFAATAGAFALWLVALSDGHHGVAAQAWIGPGSTGLSGRF